MTYKRDNYPAGLDSFEVEEALDWLAEHGHELYRCECGSWLLDPSGVLLHMDEPGHFVYGPFGSWKPGMNHNPKLPPEDGDPV